MRWMIDNPSRVTHIVDARGRRQIARNKATLRAEILGLLARGHRTRKSMTVALQTSWPLTLDALAYLEGEHLVESFISLSSRGRMDVFWCLSDPPPMKNKPVAIGFKAGETLIAMQAHALRSVTAAVTP